MDGSDDPYEAFMYLALFYAVDGDEHVYDLARRMWDAITWQWTQYGQIDRDFDRYYDWMHHGEGNLFLYFFGFTKPESVVDRQRAQGFARMYTGEDPLAPNYDPILGIIRAPHTGSDGPRFVLTAEDYSTHRDVLKDYPPPFEDLKTVARDSPTANWLDDAVYEEVLAAINARTARGDIPLNLNATGLITHAFLYSGDPALREWVVDYLSRWNARAVANGGVLPDNVGLSGEVGEYLDGKWWGGHYGWRWPHGLLTIIEPVLNACLNAYLLTGDPTNLDLVRSQLDTIFDLGHDDDGMRMIPHKHLDAGWTDHRVASPFHAIHLWAATLEEQDRARADRTQGSLDARQPRVPTVPFASKHYNLNTIAWYEYVNGRSADYPENVLAANHELIDQQLARLRSHEGDPLVWPVLDRIGGRTDGPSMQTDGYAIHAWQEFCPVYFESLIQLMWGAPMHISHGGLQFATFRYFNAESKRPGLPPEVAALVSKIDGDGALLTLSNTSSELTSTVVVQAGSFREHRVDSVSFELDSDMVTVDVGGSDFTVTLAPLSTIGLRVALSRRAQDPTYETPWSRRHEWPTLIVGRQP
ncbi:hypothetical protein ACI2IP_09495 [Microbacterium sp. NPDC090218]